MNFSDSVEVELKQLEKQSRSACPAVANKVAKLLQHMLVLKETRNSQSDKLQDNDMTISDVLSVLLTTYDSKNPKLILQSLVILHKIVSINDLAKAHHEQVLSQLVLIKHNEDVNVQRRIIQTCLKFINPQLLSINDIEFIVKVYAVCFQISTCKLVEIQKIAVGGLLQLTEMIYTQDRFVTYSEEEVNKCFGLFGEFLAYMVENKNVHWIPKGMLGIVWDIVLDIVSLQGANIVNRKQLQPKLDKFLEVIHKKCFVKHAENKLDFIRFYRALVYLAIHLKMGINKLLKLEIVSEVEKGFIFSVYLQGILTMICSKELCAEFDNNIELVTFFDIITKISEELCLSHQSLKIPTKRPKCYLKSPTVLLTIDPHVVFDDSILYRTLLIAIFDFRMTYDQQFSTAGEQLSANMRRSFDRICPYLLKSNRYLISIEVQEDQMRKSVLQFQLWFIVMQCVIQLCSKNKMTKTKNKFLEELGVLARRMDKRAQAIKSSQSLQVMFNIIFGYQELLDTSSLSVILKCFKDAEQIYFKHKSNKQWDSSVGHELQSVINMIIHLYEKNTIQLNDSSLKNTVEALNEVTLSVLEELADSTEAEQQYSIRMKTFGVRKMKTVIENNCQHITKVWNFIVAHFLSLCSCKFEDIRVQSVDILSQTISNLLVLNTIPSEQLLSIYFEIVKTKYTDVKTLVIKHLKRFLSDHGFTIEEKSLIQIVKILKLTEMQTHLHPVHHKEQQEIAKLMEAENELNEVIIRECLVNIASKQCLAELIASYRIISSCKNNEYSGVGLLWLIADHVRQLWMQTHLVNELYNEEFLELHTEIFRRLQILITTNAYNEVRQSGIHILTQIIAENMKLYHRAFLENILNGLYFRVFQEVVRRYLKEASTIKDHQNIIVKEWLQTCDQMYKNFNKLVRKLRTEAALDESFKLRILSQILKNLENIEFQYFQWKTLEFLKQLKQEAIKEHLPFEIEILKKIKNRLQTIDKKERINKNRIVPELEQMVQIYANLN